MISSRIISIATKQGIIPFDISSIDILPIPHATYRLTPTGGVNSPIARLTIMTVPRWIGSIPSCNATGANSGVKMYSADVESRKHPAIHSTIFTIMKKITVHPPVTFSM